MEHKPTPICLKTFNQNKFALLIKFVNKNHGKFSANRYQALNIHIFPLYTFCPCFDIKWASSCTLHSSNVSVQVERVSPLSFPLVVSSSISRGAKGALTLHCSYEQQRNSAGWPSRWCIYVREDAKRIPQWKRCSCLTSAIRADSQQPCALHASMYKRTRLSASLVSSNSESRLAAIIHSQQTK